MGGLLTLATLLVVRRGMLRKPQPPRYRYTRLL